MNEMKKAELRDQMTNRELHKWAIRNRKSFVQVIMSNIDNQIKRGETQNLLHIY